MAETKFTPGPWKTSNGTDIFPVADTEGWFYIADCDPSNAPLSRDDEGMSYAQAQANARLIAAAPKLYEKLAEIRKWMDVDVLGPWDKKFTAEIDALLANARGEAA